MLNYGILSTASICARYIAGVRESKNGFVYGIASRNIENAKQFAKKHNIEHCYGSYSECIEDENIDIIYIPAMNAIHYTWAKYALECHKHVVVEKPFVLLKEQAIELFELAKKNNCFLMEAQKSVFLPTTLKLKELLDSRTIGDIKYINLSAGFPGRFPDGHWMTDHASGGGALYGSCTYTVEFLSFLFDEPSYKYDAHFIKGKGSADDVVHFTLSFDNILVSSTISMCCALKNEAVFYGTKGYIVIKNFWKSNGLDVHIDGNITHYDFPYTSEFVYENNHIQECIEKGFIESPVMNKEKTIYTVEIVENLYKQM
ncbi:MAG: Gfo/Idh/MocA family protein [Floccifex sp.]